MTYRFIYATEPERIVYSAIMDSKVSLPQIKGKSGFDTKAYIDSQLLQAEGSLIYKIETFQGNMVGYISLVVTNMGLNVNKIQQVIRPNFLSFQDEVNQAISGFINSGQWKGDYLPEDTVTSIPFSTPGTIFRVTNTGDLRVTNFGNNRIIK